MGNVRVDYDFIKKKYDNLFVLYPFLKDVYMKRSVFENKDKDLNLKIIDSLFSVKKIKINGKFITPSKMFYKHGVGSKKSNEPLTDEEKKLIDEYLDYKRYVYYSNSPIAEIECTDIFSNYSGFLYKNGVIASDRFKNINAMSELKADSIYFFNVLNFKKRMALSKFYLRANSNIKPLNHAGNWEERVSRIVNMGTSDEMINGAKQFVKKRTN